MGRTSSYVRCRKEGSGEVSRQGTHIDLDLVKFQLAGSVFFIVMEWAHACVNRSGLKNPSKKLQCAIAAEGRGAQLH